jgi:hypothetical protein
MNDPKKKYFNNDVLRNYMTRKGIKPNEFNFYYYVPEKLLQKYLNNEVVVPLSLIVKLK